jgi:glutathione S-transferase
MIRVWGRRSSVNVQKVLWTLAELDIPFARETVGGSFGGNRDADFLRMNPNGLIPVILDGDVTMFESNAIVRYLAARYRAGLLRPKDHKSLALAEQWMEWQQTTLYPKVQDIFWNNVRLPAEKRDAAAVAAAEHAIVEPLRIADRHLAQHDWFAGDRLSFGDIVMGCVFWRYMALDCTKPDLPHVMEWLAALKTREAYRAWVMVPVGRNVNEWAKYEKELG